jgi:hypothetical protein
VWPAAKAAITGAESLLASDVTAESDNIAAAIVSIDIAVRSNATSVTARSSSFTMVGDSPIRAIEGVDEPHAARTAEVATRAPDERNIVRRLIGEEVLVFFIMSPSFSCQQQR